MEPPLALPTGPALDRIKQGMRAAWMAGDFGVVAKTISGGAVEFVERLALAPGTRVLDVACGTGNLALPLARGGAQVTGLDLAPNLIVQARERAAAESLAIRFDEGDAEQMPYADASFDVVVSMFGAMFAPRPEVVVKEFARVLRPGGRLRMANWNPDSFSGQMFAVSRKHAPPPPVPEPVLWGDEATVRARLEGPFRDIETEIVKIAFDMPASPAGAVAFFRKFFGPTQTAFARMDGAAQDAFTAELEALWTGANRTPNDPSRTLVNNEYLQVSATRV